MLDSVRTTKRKRRHCCGGCSSAHFFYLVVGCALVISLLNLVVGQNELSIGRGKNNIGDHQEKDIGWAVPPMSSPLTSGSTAKISVSVEQEPGYKNNMQTEILSLSQAAPDSPTQHACDGFDGVFLISQGDIGGAAGTIFFQFVVGQILYAERYNLKPYVHLDNVSYIVYDPLVHGQGPGVSFTALGGMNASHIVRPNGHWRDRVPGPPTNVTKVAPKKIHLGGTGVWNNYFQPISDFQPGDTSCESKPLVQMDFFLITPGIHGFAEWAPRCWRYQYAPDYMTKPHIPLHEWLEPQRILANRVVNKYIKLRPEILQTAERVNPDCSLPHHPCLGLHIRQSDKAAGRRQIQTHEFLSYAIAFIKAGGKAIYLATDSTKVLAEVKTTWPAYIQDKLRTMGNDVIRSSDEKAVFDIGESSHDRTNREILIEIAALANCHFMIHGLSAVTESSIWVNVELHDRSVNLEDPEHLSPLAFSTLVQMVLRVEPTEHWPTRRTMYQWWEQGTASAVPLLPGDQTLSEQVCQGYAGVFLISATGPKDTAGIAFFHSILNQLLYAEMNNLKPLIHLGQESPLIFDEAAHTQGSELTLEFQGMFNASTEHDTLDTSGAYPGAPVKVSEGSVVKSLDGSGIWDSYFYPVAAEIKQGDTSCRQLPLVSMGQPLISSGISLWCPWCLRSWRYDGVPDHLWKPSSMKLADWYEPMRKKGHEIVKKYYRFLPHMERQVEKINPTTDANNTCVPCLAIHLRNSFKKGDHRQVIKAKEFQPYMEAYQRAGGQAIYIATDSHRVLNHLTDADDFPDDLQKMIRSQGRYVVRSSGGKINKWPVHQLADHHRINSEVLADILAMSKCHLFLHGFSTTSEAVFYLNPDLQERSLNMEDPNRMSTDYFEQLSKNVINKFRPARQMAPVLHEEVLSPRASMLLSTRPMNTTILTRNPPRQCRSNSIVYLAQKQHSTYGRDSYSIMKKSLDLLFKNYLSLGQHKENTDIFIFHTGDFNGTDLLEIESRFGPDYYGMVKLVDLSGSKYWQRPSWHVNDDPNKIWYAYPLFSEGYRHMMRWYAIGLWDFFDNFNQQSGCSYRYLFRLDEDSYLYSPIRYDLFDLMKNNNYVYGYRMCAYEMRVTQRIMKVFRRHKGTRFNPVRDIDLDMCGFYNNFFVADIQHFNSPPVKDFLRVVDRQGLIYRRRLGDLMIHSMSVYLFAPQERIHRFLDFTYQHSTENQTSGCVVWGGIEAGYDDPNAEKTLADYYQRQVVDLNCPYNATFLSESDLSPSYAHYPTELKGRLFLQSIMSGNVEKPRKGILSG